MQNVTSFVILQFSSFGFDIAILPYEKTFPQMYHLLPWSTIKGKNYKRKIKAIPELQVGMGAVKFIKPL